MQSLQDSRLWHKKQEGEKVKPIILDMNELSDSVIMYEARPNKGIKYFIYVVLATIVAAIIWMTFFKIDIVVKSNGIFRQENKAQAVSSETTGILESFDIEDGDYVNEGDTIAVIKSDGLEDTISGLNNKISSLVSHKDILGGYLKYLDGEEDKLDEFRDNALYNDIKVRAELLKAQVNKNKADAVVKEGVYKTNIDNTSKTISEYNDQIHKLEITRDCIYSRNNSFYAGEDSYYCSIINSYMDNYYSTELSYNNKISEIDLTVSRLETQLKNVLTQEEVTEIENQITDAQNSRKNVIDEKNITLLSMESQQISSVEQQIEAAKEGLRTAEASLASIKAEETALNAVDSPESRELSVISEKNSVNAEIADINRQIKEYETDLSGYVIQNDKCEIKAKESGILNVVQGIQIGSVIEQGTVIADIFPKSESRFYAEVYVENQDIGKVVEGQNVKFEVASYPSNEYGYFTGTVGSISKDIKADEKSGEAYYYVKVNCDNDTLINTNGEEVKIMNGMACQAKLIVYRQNVMQYLLKKLDLFG